MVVAGGQLGHLTVGGDGEQSLGAVGVERAQAHRAAQLGRQLLAHEAHELGAGGARVGGGEWPFGAVDGQAGGAVGVHGGVGDRPGRHGRIERGRGHQTISFGSGLDATPGFGVGGVVMCRPAQRRRGRGRRAPKRWAGASAAGGRGGGQPGDVQVRVGAGVRGVAMVGVAVVTDEPDPSLQRAHGRDAAGRAAVRPADVAREPQRALIPGGLAAGGVGGHEIQRGPVAVAEVADLAAGTDAQRVGAQDPQRVGHDARVDLRRRASAGHRPRRQHGERPRRLDGLRLAEAGRAGHAGLAAAQRRGLRVRGAVAPQGARIAVLDGDVQLLGPIDQAAGADHLAGRHPLARLRRRRAPGPRRRTGQSACAA